MEKYRTNVNGRLFELSSNVPLSIEQQQAEVVRYLQQRRGPVVRNIGLVTVPGTRIAKGGRS